ncbi:hypothetical protein E2C01_066290 [Portunus trituberculatus]|uniref:Uncharacterized protein n=1 Tax=Portunus trituberculatus TaxID=210409 RepID=A0A5B7HTG0_PORTR|nr:hypothetical protein [Portunus trituberculatus]
MKTQKIQERGHESKSSRCAHGRNEDRERRREQKRGYCQLLQTVVFREEMKIRFRRGEVVFYRLKVRSKTANVAEVNEENIEGGAKQDILGRYWESCPTWGHLWSPPRKKLRGSVCSKCLQFCVRRVVFRRQALMAPSSCETQSETFSEITTNTGGEFTAPLIQTRTGPEEN